MIERQFRAERINEILNHESVLSWVKGGHKQLDMSSVAINPENVCLVGEHGCVIFVKHQPGLFEFHTAVLPEGRGKWMVGSWHEVSEYMFTRTDAVELFTKCPDGNVAAKSGAKVVGCKKIFRTRPMWPVEDKLVAIDIYNTTINMWAETAPSLIVEGKWFHDCLHAQYKEQNKVIDVHDDDESHNRYVGAAIKMLKNHQTVKGIRFYNRWALMNGYRPVTLVSIDPLIIDIEESKLKIENNLFEVM